jgi:DNA-3-methyladenine glycosylase II
MTDSARHVPALRELASRCDRMAALIERVGPCRLHAAPSPHGHFTGLVDAIVSQQLSAKAADTILRRVHAAISSEPGIDPRALLATPDEALRGAGLSGQKLRYVRDLATRVTEGSLVLDALEGLDDEAVIEELTRVKGVGRWTAEMFLIFRLGRPDVLPVGDLGIQKGMSRLFNLRAPPSPERLVKLARPWRPHRSIACWYLWRLTELKP